jgi:8-oxo-dGTP pyrophosphatase MutT (NUDIX family)
MDRLMDVRGRFAAHLPLLNAEPFDSRAAVALILCEEGQGDRSDLSLLFIRRAEDEGDRWSGHIAFPGGRIDQTDESPSHTAERETFEEVGIPIGQLDLVARLDDLAGTAESILVSGFVYLLEAKAPLVLNHEIAEAIWLPLHEIERSDRQVVRRFKYLEHDLELPGLRVVDDERSPVLWGLSYRFLQILMEKLERRLPAMPWHDDL